MVTIREKISQMLLVGIKSKEDISGIIELIKKEHIGGVLLYKNNYSSIREMNELINLLKKSNSGNIPLFISIDQEWGRVNRMPSEIHNFKSLNKIASLSDDLINEYAFITSSLLSSVGVNMDLAPVLDLKNQKDSMAIGNRAISNNPHKVYEVSKIICDNFKKNNIMPVVKHFPGHGSVNIDSHMFLPIISNYNKVLENDIIPFELLFNNTNCDALMIGHLLIPKLTGLIPASLSKKFIENELIKKYNYDGLIMTDELGMKSISLLYGKFNSFKKAIYAKSDIICCKYETNYIPKLLDVLENFAMKKGLEKQIDNSYNKINKYKEKYNLSNNEVKCNINVENINAIIDKINNS